MRPGFGSSAFWLRYCFSYLPGEGELGGGELAGSGGHPTILLLTLTKFFMPRNEKRVQITCEFPIHRRERIKICNKFKIKVIFGINLFIRRYYIYSMNSLSKE
jgi:hypothetical protein